MFKIPDTFEIKPTPGWGSGVTKSTATAIPAPQIDNAEVKKKAFGIELAKGIQPFQAACTICGQDTQQALWITANWLNDPEVIAARDVYKKGVDTSGTLLDNEQLASRLLQMAEERNSSGTFYILDGKDRLKALELYAKVRGFTDNKDIQPNQFIHNQMVIKFVEPDKKQLSSSQETVDLVPADTTVPKLKLVG